MGVRGLLPFKDPEVVEQRLDNDLSQGRERWVDQAVRLKPPEGPGIGSDTSAADVKVLDPPGGSMDPDSIAQGVHRSTANVRVSA